ncbi:helix-turn-helix domain-containing protein [Porticoccus sp. W117]|uniref:AraC family transcriptional regulator n=1 Tax=Porticoccus sp. W117 TaxID=3054777 RepID=UPI002592CE79|nr:helix-turn-helix domain-containing protein [Porticoccus sp. W117]MDM3872448.1 helix-turn-helix domain-containing protein [Porticoccus sp. W117]
MLSTITTLCVGFSVVMAVVFLLLYLAFLKNINKSWFAVCSGTGLLTTLCALQLAHLDFLGNQTDLLDSQFYRLLTFITPPLFYYFSRAVMFPSSPVKPLLILHLLPVSLVFYLPREIAVPLAFLIGTSYCCWLFHLISRLRAHRKRYAVELFFFGFFSVLALLVLILGFSSSYIDSAYFYYFYANGIALAFVLITASFIIYPDLVTELNEAVSLSYSKSTLNNIDVDTTLKKLNQLMAIDKIYQNENLSLSFLADTMGLSNHQLSELINTRHGMSFSKYIRSQRVEAAKKLLLEDPKASILSISMELGFRSQSNFYSAFKEITGQSPGSFRQCAES